MAQIADTDSNFLDAYGFHGGERCYPRSAFQSPYKTGTNAESNIFTGDTCSWEKGSLLVFHNNLWHRSGANTTRDQHRMAMNTGYIPWFIDRPKETWPLVKREIHDQLSPRLQELLVRSVER
jgi:ectoine hydroxylase-related dioxygenase (phytanoyl-CoA dioxygenase family)